MKKLITSAAALLLFAGISFAADTKVNTHSNSAANTMAPAASNSFVSARSLAEIIEENAELRIKLEDLTNQAENLSTVLDYSKMMHATISNLKDEAMNEQKENSKSQLDYARMMTATIMNLDAVIAGK